MIAASVVKKDQSHEQRQQDGKKYRVGKASMAEHVAVPDAELKADDVQIRDNGTNRPGEEQSRGCGIVGKQDGERNRYGGMSDNGAHEGGNQDVRSVLACYLIAPFSLSSAIFSTLRPRIEPKT